MSKLLVGWGEADITPDGRVVELAGQYYQRVATGIHSRLKLTVLLLESGGRLSAMIAVDHTGMKSEIIQELKQVAVRTVPGLSPECIVINAIHTHNAPGLALSRHWWTPEPKAITGAEYLQMVSAGMVEALRTALTDRRPSGIVTGFDSARLGHCRRVVYTDGTAEMYGDTGRDDFAGMEGGEDSGVDLLFIVDESRRPTGVIVNVACPAQVMEAAYKISSDYMGALREKLKQKFGSDFKTLPQISAAGCQSPRDLSRNYRCEPDFWHEDGVEVLASRLQDAVMRGWSDRGDFDFSPEFSHVSRQLQLPVRRVSYGQYLSASCEMNRLEALQSSADAYRNFCAEVKKNEAIAGRPGPYDDKKLHFVQLRNCEAVIKRYEEQDASPALPVDLHVIRLGNSVFASNPFELFLEFGQRIKARSHAGQTFLIQIANGYDGYLPSARAEQLGGYGGLVINGVVGSDGGSMLVDETVKIINEMFR